MTVEDILNLNKLDTGAVNNVLNLLEPHCFGIYIYKGRIDQFVMFYVNYTLNLPTGIICRLSFRNRKHNEITSAFSSIINRDYPKCTKFFDIFNTFQYYKRTLADKLGFTTYSLENSKPTKRILPNFPIVFIPICDHVSIIKSIFEQDFRLENLQRGNYIYLMYNYRNCLTKIGRSINPRVRERTLQGEDPASVIVAIWKAAMCTEKELHNELNHKRIRGEWFNLDLKDFQFIRNYMENN